jgi:hypothetical protein
MQVRRLGTALLSLPLYKVLSKILEIVQDTYLCYDMFYVRDLNTICMGLLDIMKEACVLLLLDLKMVEP